jgi:prevent-host-death family protein
MRQVNIHEAKTHLSRLVNAAAKGEPFVIAKAGKPLVKVVAIDATPEEPGAWLGFARHLNWKIPDDFDTMDQEEIIRLFAGEDDEPAGTA